MFLFQLNQFLLRKELENFEYNIQETLDTFTVKSSYLEGDRRVSKNRSAKVVMTCTGDTYNQHFIHYLRKLSEVDQGKGDNKVFFIEKYKLKDIDYGPISAHQGKIPNEYEVRLYFGYAHIDITAINSKEDCETGKTLYSVSFDLSLWHSKVYEITNSVNGFIVDRKLPTLQFIYDDVAVYDDTSNRYYYDEFIDRLGYEGKNLYKQRKNLYSFYDEVMCCDLDTYKYVLFFDKIIKPFQRDNFFKDTGKINNSVNNEFFYYYQKNFLQTYVSNPLANPIGIANKQTYTPILFNKDLTLTDTEPLKIAKIDMYSNTYSTNGIIQLSRVPFGLELGVYKPLNGQAPLKLFTEVGQVIKIKVQSSAGNLSDISVICNSTYILQNVTMLIIHPHNQKVYGILETPVIGWGTNSFNYKSTNNNLVDLEQYLIKGELQVWNNIFDNQDWLKFSPTYRGTGENQDKRLIDNLTFEVIYKDGDPRFIELNTCYVLQIESYTENKLI
jgi:hypothetical protein